jgi:hypothetical protein
MNLNFKKSILIALLFSVIMLSGTVHAEDVNQQILDRLNQLEQENEALKKEYQKLRELVESNKVVVEADDAETKQNQSNGKIFNLDNEYGYEILDPTTNINRKQQLILNKKQQGVLGPNSITINGGVTAIANYQSSNEPNLFGYLMRHPTGNNQVGTVVSEATIHSAQLGFTANLGDWTTANVEMLFDPEQSFGAGTNTALTRNQVQVRKAFVLFGNLDKSNFYASLGKMPVSFGLTDTVNPFTASTVWHAFGGLANGARLGYMNDGFNFSLMAIQGGAQFRSANNPVDGTAVPSRLNNYAVDVSYENSYSDEGSILFGASYQKGTAYCQAFPITHFSPCAENNPAFDVYARLLHNNWTVKAEFAKTTDEWPGTFNPSLPQFAASKVTSFDFGLKYRTTFNDKPLDYSAEFSRFEAGPSGSEWEKQDQLVLGVSSFLTPSVKLFSEYIRVSGYAPLNFLSGGHIPGSPEIPVSDISANSDILMFGVNATF